MPPHPVKSRPPRRYQRGGPGVPETEANQPPYEWLLLEDWTPWKRWFAWYHIALTARELRFVWWTHVDWRMRRWRWPWGMSFGSGTIGENRIEVQYREIIT
jgi:hypothetical protein